MALHSLYCADVPLRNCSLTHSPGSLIMCDVLFSYQSIESGKHARCDSSRSSPLVPLRRSKKIMRTSPGWFGCRISLLSVIATTEHHAAHVYCMCCEWLCEFCL